MANNESYVKSPVKAITDLLREVGWRPVQKGLWEKGKNRLFVDEIGIFQFRLAEGRWLRVRGLSHNNILQRHLKNQCIHFTDGHKLNLA
jgi:hypothetical protein